MVLLVSNDFVKMKNEVCQAINLRPENRFTLANPRANLEIELLKKKEKCVSLTKSYFALKETRESCISFHKNAIQGPLISV